jgi:mono/diheme cytochrome c family protein
VSSRPETLRCALPAMKAVIAHFAVAIGLCAFPIASHGQAEPQASNVPDVLTRQSGLRVAPMPRAAQTYATNCQGCHGELGVSASEIPTLAGRVGYFTRLPQGRRYIVQVPNVALNPSSDEDIAAVLNWVLLTYSRRELLSDFEPYTAAEVSVLRKSRIDVVAERRRVIEELVASRQIASADVLALPKMTLY